MLLMLTLLAAFPAARTDAAALEAAVIEAAARALGDAATPVAVRGLGAVTVPTGRWSVRLDSDPAVRGGAQPLRVSVWSGGRLVRRLRLSLELELPRGPVMVERGARVAVVARAPGVLAQVTGVAHASGRSGEVIPVMPVGGTKVLRARVVDAHTVEVGP